MMYATCHCLEFGRTGFSLASNSTLDRFYEFNFGHRGAGYRPENLHCRQKFGKCNVFETKNSEAFVNEAGDSPSPVMDLTQGTACQSLGPDIFELVAEDLLTLNKNLQLIIGAENPALMSAAEQIFGDGGKRMRPALIFLVSRATAEISGLKELTKEHRRLAEIIEMIHTASLVHDDVLDENDPRRGNETINQLYGTRVAVLAGDFLFAQSSWYLANLENLEVIKLISQVIKDFASGEIKQASRLFDCDIQMDEYLARSYHKTASLIAAGTKGAAIFSGANSNIINQMYNYGKNLGLSFQIVDDILDFTQSSGRNLAKGNLTAPVIFALEKDPNLRETINSRFSEVGSLDSTIEIVKNCGSIEQAWELARKKANDALENIECLPLSPFRTGLENMVKFSLECVL